MQVICEVVGVMQVNNNSWESIRVVNVTAGCHVMRVVMMMAVKQ